MFNLIKKLLEAKKNLLDDDVFFFEFPIGTEPSQVLQFLSQMKRNRIRKVYPIAPEFDRQKTTEWTVLAMYYDYTGHKEMSEYFLREAQVEAGLITIH